MPSTIVKYILDISTGKARVDVKKTEKAVGELNKDLKKTETQAKKSVRSMEQMESAKAAVGKAAKGVLALAAALTVASGAAFKFTKDIVDATNDLNDMRNKTGLATSTIQGLGLAFQASGQEASAAAEGLAQLPAKMSEMATEGSRANKAANRLGISLVDLEGNARSNDEVFRDVVGAIQAVEDPSQRAKVAFELLGESAGRLNQAIGAGAEFSAFIDIAEKWGVDTGPSASKAAADFQSDLALLQMVFSGTRQEVGRTLGTVGDFGDMIVWVGKQLAFLREFLRETDHFFFVLKGTIVETMNDLGGMSAVFSPLLGIINLQLSALEKVLGIFDSISGTDLSGSLRETVDRLSLSIKSAAIEATGLTDAFEAGDKARSEFVKDVELLRSGGAGTKPLFDGGGTGNAGGVDVLIDTSGIEAGTKFLDDFIAKSKILTERDQLEATFAAIEDEIRNAAEASGDFDRGMEALEIATNEYMIQVAGVNFELKKLEESEAAKKQAEEFAKLGDQITRAGDGLSSLLTGDVSGFMRGLTPKIEEGIKSAIGSAGGSAGAMAMVAPVVGAIQSVFGAAAQIGQAGLIDPETGEMATDARAKQLAVESVEERIKNQARAIEIGMKALPDILIKVLPGILDAFGLMLIDVLVSLPRLFAESMTSALQDALPSVFGDPTKNKSGDDVDPSGGFKGIATLINMLADAIKSRESGGRIPFAESGLRFTGQSSGLAVLHPGEFVVPRTGQAGQEVQRDLGSQSGGGGITINVSGTIVESNAIDELARRIENRFLAFGGGSSPLFGGA